MTGSDLFGTTFACPCGRTHTIQPREVFYAPEAVRRMPDVCRRALAAPPPESPRAAVLMDPRTRAAAGADVAAALERARWQVRTVVIGETGDRDVVCDDRTRANLDALVKEADLLVSVGSGVITDLAKWIAFDRRTPHVAFATAASMNGYTSANVAPTLAGVKSLVRARPPVAVVAGPDVLAAAPYELTAAGFGDLLAKTTSGADWRLNHLLFADYFCERSVGLIARIEPLYLDRPEAVRAREPAALAAVYQALLLTGVAMTMAESSAPASGAEHLVSHTLDMTAPLHGLAHDLHGRQVGVGTILAADLYRRVLAVESPVPALPAADVDRAYWGPLAPAVAAEFGAKHERLAAARDAIPTLWDTLRETLAPLVRPPEAVRNALHRAGAACRAEHIGCTPDRLRDALLHAHQMRSRFTVLDLAHLVGVLPGAAGEIAGACA